MDVTIDDTGHSYSALLYRVRDAFMRLSCAATARQQYITHFWKAGIKSLVNGQQKVRDVCSALLFMEADYRASYHGQLKMTRFEPAAATCARPHIVPVPIVCAKSVL
jgi:hypothetical protein